jgi:hypothetical protein
MDTFDVLIVYGVFGVLFGFRRCDFRSSDLFPLHSTQVSFNSYTFLIRPFFCRMNYSAPFISEKIEFIVRPKNVLLFNVFLASLPLFYFLLRLLETLELKTRPATD